MSLIQTNFIHKSPAQIYKEKQLNHAIGRLIKVNDELLSLQYRFQYTTERRGMPFRRCAPESLEFKLRSNGVFYWAHPLDYTMYDTCGSVIHGDVSDHEYFQDAMNSAKKTHYPNTEGDHITKPNDDGEKKIPLVVTTSAASIESNSVRLDKGVVTDNAFINGSAIELKNAATTTEDHISVRVSNSLSKTDASTNSKLTDILEKQSSNTNSSGPNEIRVIGIHESKSSGVHEEKSISNEIKYDSNDENTGKLSNKEENFKSIDFDSNLKSNEREEKSKSSGNEEKLKSDSHNENIKSNGHDEKSRSSDNEGKVKSDDRNVKFKSNSHDEKSKSSSNGKKPKSDSHNENIKSNGHDENIKSNGHDEKSKSSGNEEKLKSDSHNENIKSHGHDEKSRSSGNEEKVKSDERNVKFKSNSHDEKSKSSSNGEKLKSHGNDENLKFNHYYEEDKFNTLMGKLKSNGYDGKNKSMGNDDNIKSNGEDEKKLSLNHEMKSNEYDEINSNSLSGIKSNFQDEKPIMGFNETESIKSAYEVIVDNESSKITKTAKSAPTKILTQFNSIAAANFEVNYDELSITDQLTNSVNNKYNESSSKEVNNYLNNYTNSLQKRICSHSVHTFSSLLGDMVGPRPIKSRKIKSKTRIQKNVHNIFKSETMVNDCTIIDDNIVKLIGKVSGFKREMRFNAAKSLYRQKRRIFI